MLCNGKLMNVLKKARERERESDGGREREKNAEEPSSHATYIENRKTRVAPLSEKKSSGIDFKLPPEAGTRVCECVRVSTMRRIMKKFGPMAPKSRKLSRRNVARILNTQITSL